MTHAEYAENLEENLLALESRLKEGKYRPLPVRRRWIAKAGSVKMRSLGIPVLEDKIVQQAVRMILEPIWENDFADESIGYRPGRSPRNATQELGEALHDGKHRWVVEADNRRSQRRSYNMTAFLEAWQRWEIPMPRVVEKPWPQTRQAPLRTI